jgi:hypothetical protein
MVTSGYIFNIVRLAYLKATKASNTNLHNLFIISSKLTKRPKVGIKMVPSTARASKDFEAIFFSIVR